MRERPSPRDTSITIYGRKPVLEALRDPARRVAKVIVATNAEGAIIHEITEAARGSGVKVFHAAPRRVKSLAGNGRHDQGVVADVEAPRMSTLDDYLATPPDEAEASRHLLLLDGVANPSNVGLILRVAAAMGIGAVILPRVGTPDVGPLVIKASAGLAFQTPILHCRTPEQAAAALHDAGLPLLGLAAADGQPLPTATLPEQAVFVAGGETAGLTPEVRALVDSWVSIPMAPGVESLNVATAVAILGYELRRRQLIAGAQV